MNHPELRFNLAPAAADLRTETTESGEVRWYQNSGEAIDLAKLLGHLESGGLPPAFGGPERPEQPVISVMKYGAYIPIADPTETFEPVKVSRYLRVRWRIRNTVADWRLKLGEWVAGVKLADGEDW